MPPRAIAFLRNWDWKHIFAESLVVVLGVVIGMEVSNWNQDRQDQERYEKLLVQLAPGLEGNISFYSSVNTYYDTTDTYAAMAMAGWARDPAISDREFVSAAYQASQVIASGVNDENLAGIFGGSQLLDIEDDGVRAALIHYVTTDTAFLQFDRVTTPYRENVRRIMPEAIQLAIREQCGDRARPENSKGTYLPATCDLDAPEQDIRAAAAALRAQPELLEDLRWHISETATYRYNMSKQEKTTQQLIDALAQQHK